MATVCRKGPTGFWAANVQLKRLAADAKTPQLIAGWRYGVAWALNPRIDFLTILPARPPEAS
jgi:hypothetical protein